MFFKTSEIIVARITRILSGAKVSAKVSDFKGFKNLLFFGIFARVSQHAVLHAHGEAGPSMNQHTSSVCGALGAGALCTRANN